MNQVIETWAPRLARHRLALLVMTRKNWSGWSEVAAERLMKGTLPAVAGMPGVDATRPLLFGFSAGGQMALRLWRSDPAAFAGLVLDAAYPLDEEKAAQGVVEALPAPAATTARVAPIFALVGDQDGGARIWRRIEQTWTGVPKVVRYVPGKGHEWLFGPDETAALESWLDQL